MEKFIRAAGVAIRIADSEKNSPAVVLLHGYLESLDVWDDFAAGLARRYRVIAPDLPGHGISEVHDEVHTMEFLAGVVRGALDELGVDRCVMVGHSMGGYVAQAFAEAWPERLLGLALFHSTPLADSAEKQAARRREIDLIRAGKKDALARLSPGNGFAPDNRARLTHKIEELSDQITLTEDEGIVAILRGLMERPDRSAMLRALKVPVLLIFGRHDGYIAPEIAEQVIAGLPDASAVWLEHSGHMGFVEEPATALAALEAWIDALPKG
ncbi:MAG: alpha/beta fold hydrolase [Rikenellaceae bacterium]|nr:alpha/beta fold hydrolase [Rikenellaceae bacterium]